MTFRTNLLQKLALIAGGILCALLLLELGLRATGFLLLSLRELADRNRTEGNGGIRILCVGESTTYLGGNKAWPRQLEEILNALGAPRRFTVINKGIPGTNTTRIAENLPSWLYTYHPDAVVAMMGVNDGETMMVTPLEEEGETGERFLKNLRLYKLFTLIREGARRMGGGPDTFLDPDELTASLREEVEKTPRDAAGYLKLGDALLEQGYSDQARAAFQKAGELSPSADAFFGLGMALKKSAKWKKARAAFEACLVHDPKNDRALTEIGLCWLMQHMKDRAHAEKAFARAIELNPRNDMALAGMAFCIWKEKNYPETIAFAGRSLAANPKNEWAYEIIWSCYLQMHDTPAAIKACERAIAANPRHYLALSELATLYPKMGDTARSEEYSRKAREIVTADYNPLTARNYRRIREIMAERRVRLVAMQYPLRSVKPLQRMLAPAEKEVYVSNEESFREALRTSSPRTYFVDHFGGDFGHCTPEGNRLIAENLARVILSEVFPASRPGSAVTH